MSEVLLVQFNISRKKDSVHAQNVKEHSDTLAEALLL